MSLFSTRAGIKRENENRYCTQMQIKPKAPQKCETESHLRWFLVGPAGCGAQHRKPITYRLRTGEPDLWKWCTDLVC